MPIVRITLYALPVGGATAPTQIHQHLASAKKWGAGVLLVDQALEQIIALYADAFEKFELLLRIERGAWYAGQHTLPTQGNRIRLFNPAVACHGKLIPDFFKPVEIHLESPNLAI